MTPDDIAERVRISRSAQGLPASTDDLVTLRRLVAILGTPRKVAAGREAA